MLCKVIRDGESSCWHTRGFCSARKTISLRDRKGMKHIYKLIIREITLLELFSIVFAEFSFSQISA